MRALVLTYDKYQPLAEHMIVRYENCWSRHPFTFRLPYQVLPEQLINKYNTQIETISSDSAIVPTLNNLIADLDDNEWVFWCIDDRYPVSMDVKKIEKLVTWLDSEEANDVDGVGFTYNDKDWNDENIDTNSKLTTSFGEDMFRIRNYKIIWFHQFVRVKVLRALFAEFPESIKNAKEMDQYKDKAVLPEGTKRYLCKKQLALYGESSSRGKITQNCFTSMRRHDIRVPDNFEVTNSVLLKGKQYWGLRTKIERLRSLF
jgi:hypothetical protein